MRWPRFSLGALIAVIAFVAISVSHFNTSLNLRHAQEVIARQQAELSRHRSELGVFEVKDRSKAHVIFVRQLDDKAWRWRVYLPPTRRYMMKWATDEVPSEGLSSLWEGQNFQPIPQDSSTFNVDVFLRRGSNGKWRCILRYPWGELTRELPDGHSLISPEHPVVIRGDPGYRPGELILSDLHQPFVLFRYQVVPQTEFDAAQGQGQQPVGMFPGIMVWIEAAK